MIDPFVSSCFSEWQTHTAVSLVWFFRSFLIGREQSGLAPLPSSAMGEFSAGPNLSVKYLNSALKSLFPFRFLGMTAMLGQGLDVFQGWAVGDARNWRS